MAHALARPFPRSLLVALGAALAGGLVALALIGLVRLDRAHTHADFSISVPHGWKASRTGSAAILRSRDGAATVIVRRSGALHGSLPPPKECERHSVTVSGWCPGLRTYGR